VEGGGDAVSWDFKMRLTAKHMIDPQPGDRFSEQCCFFVHVIGREGDRVIVERYTTPSTVPDDGKRVVYESVEEFKRAYSYQSIPGYWVIYYDNKAPFEHYKPVEEPEGAASGLASRAPEPVAVWREDADGDAA
jgi:hypothetical protein